MPCSHVTAFSRRSCPRPGCSTFRPCVTISETTSTTAIMIHVTTTDSDMPIPPIVKAVSQFNSLIRVAPRSPILSLPLSGLFSRGCLGYFFHFPMPPRVLVTVHAYVPSNVFSCVSTFFPSVPDLTPENTNGKIIFFSYIHR